MEDLRELSRELVRDILNLAEDVEAGPALSDEDIDHRVIANLEEVVHHFSGTRAHQAQHTQGPGCLPFDIPSAVLEHQVLCGVPAGQIAAMFGVSKRTIRRRMQQYGLRKTDLYSAVNDKELDRIVSEIHRSHPNTSYKLMRGHLNARGVRVSISRLQESLRSVDAEGVYMRRLRLRVLRRRQYSVPGLNSLWHIDGHHKLIRWRFVVHGGGGWIQSFSGLPDCG
ncbi:uncharacterized protein LOC116050774 [Sander lucioperca]|uniref:uncharacterized protein LOC116050774 n=1 Tax=Sander lucioperca TaxID=283035 RepID=UPI001653A569|nr:uncharacterized protein LOC116050774 [Sander lucioperca]